MQQNLPKHTMASHSTLWRLVILSCLPFGSLPTLSVYQPEICHVVHVLSVVIDVDDTASQAISRLGASQGTLYELPTCPVCLERMDSAITGLITVPCSHTFHCMCLSKWGDSRFVPYSIPWSVKKNGLIFLVVQLPGLSLFSNTFVIPSFLYGFSSIVTFHPLCRPNLFELLCLFLLLFNYKSLDMSHLWQHWVWSIWPRPCSSSLPKHDTFIRFRTGDSACMGLCRRRICSPSNPKQS